MQERFRQIIQRFLDFWNRYNRRQKAIVISVILVVFVTFGILAVVISKPQYEVITTCSSYNEMSQVTTVLSENGYAFETNEAAMTVSVRAQDKTNAKMLLATSSIKVDGYSYEDEISEKTYFLLTGT